MSQLLWLIPACALGGFLVLLVGGRRLGDPLAGWVATAAVAGSFVASLAVFVDLTSRTATDRQMTQTLFTWIPAGNFHVGLGLLVDPLSITMCLFVTGVGALIHMYAIGYMRGDPRFPAFFVYLNLFIFSMLMLVLGDNLLVTFLGWEGVGLCSYFLISFWFTDEANASAGKKAFIANRIGDWGFMTSTFLVWITVGSISYVDIAAAAPTIAAVTATAIIVLFFIAATGKSAQIPLFVWLPDAMLGPTPVSALIHAATMVTAGVYLLIRLNPLLAAAGWANDLIAWVGALTALLAATIAVAQNDIKKVLAYSTISQLGYMFVAVGTGSYVAGMFHMVTHAFFKALLFMGSGAVITRMAHEQDMRRYGNLRKYMPITAGTFIVGWLAIAGVPPFSGFWSKDEILGGIWNWHGGSVAARLMWLIMLVTALITAFYMSRQVFMTFFGEEKWRDPANLVDAGAGAGAGAGADADAVAFGDAHDEGSHHGLTPDFTPRESSWTMTAPMVALAVLATIGGLMNLPFGGLDRLGRWLEPVLATEHHGPTGGTLVALATVAIVAALVGIGIGVLVYLKGRIDARHIELPVFAKGWYIDSSITAFTGTGGLGRRFFDGLDWFDRHIIDGAVNGAGALARGSGTRLRSLQNGRVRAYAFGIAIGAFVLMAYVVTRMTW